jgi:hypothetical protein
VAVFINYPNQKAFIEHLNKTSPEQPDASWLYQIEEKIFAELKMNSPDILFVKATSRNDAESDYIMSFDIDLTRAGEDIEIAGLKESEYKAFLVVSTLKQNQPCGFGRSGVLETENTVSKYGKYENDIFIAIEHNIDGHGSISGKIKEYEASHPVPPRGPEILVTLDRAYVSPLEGEREMKIKIKVRNCKGQEVWEKSPGLPVLLPRTTARGEIKESEECRFSQGSGSTDHLMIIFIQRPVGACVTYTLKKGMHASVDMFKILVCGMRKKVTKEVFIPIDGIALRGESEGYAFPETDNEIKFELAKVSPKGGREPLPGRKITITPKGLIDGALTPVGRVTTGNGGRAILNYRSGLKEKILYVLATFQPPGYPEKAYGKTSVTIIDKPYDWFGTVLINQTCNYEQRDSKSQQKGFWVNEESSISSDRTLHLTLRFLLKQNEPPVLTAKDVSGTSRYVMTTKEQKAWADCKDKQSGKTVKVKPGDTQKTIIKMIGELTEKDLRISPSLHIDRIANEYTFDFGVSGLYWLGKMTRTETFTDVCDKGSKTNQTGPLDTGEQKYNLESLHFTGHTNDLFNISGDKTLESNGLEHCETNYNWTLKRIEKNP